jgi:hypothetical protein
VKKKSKEEYGKNKSKPGTAVAMPVVPAPQEAKVGGWIELRSSRPVRATTRDLV